MSPDHGDRRARPARPRSRRFLEGLVAVALEHQGGGAPDVDLGYHGERRLPPVSARSKDPPLAASLVVCPIRFGDTEPGQPATSSHTDSIRAAKELLLSLCPADWRASSVAREKPTWARAGS